nr:hypothetical protein CFP56_53735 [Quercus suber]
MPSRAPLFCPRSHVLPNPLHPLLHFHIYLAPRVSAQLLFLPFSLSSPNTAAAVTDIYFCSSSQTYSIPAGSTPSILPDRFSPSRTYLASALVWDHVWIFLLLDVCFPFVTSSVPSLLECP